ncbi:hypothetical protein SDC9_155715 [bioreactor metagenome]|uniref:Methyltransferase domain-containing protein n=1 Tax=bioreactor metagenome TaxID=1076179 RepID=A0A645F7H4_9ZZZZ|nr:class I SAM-dependent methyltransferase [Oscillospiraceae bacterium]
MKQDNSTKSWNNLGKEWIELAQAGESRMAFIMPYMLNLMRDVSNKTILDLGCGEGGYSRELCKKNAMVTSVDCSEIAIKYSVAEAQRQGLSIQHFIRNSKIRHRKLFCQQTGSDLPGFVI